jgi:signal transduction histidine kinase
MSSRQVARHVLVTRRIEELSGIRPVTLLIALGIALITAILLITGIAATHLRQQAIRTADGELARVGSVLAAASNRSFHVIDAQLAEVGAQLGQSAMPNPARFLEVASGPATLELLLGKIGRFPYIEAAALVDADGETLNRAGPWPADFASRGLVAAIAAEPARRAAIGAAIPDARTGAPMIPFAHRIDGPAGKFYGAVIGMVPGAYFNSLFATAPLPPDALIVLYGPDGSKLAAHPQRSEPTAKHNAHDLAAALHDSSETRIRHVNAADGDWQIEAWRALDDYPAAVRITRQAGQVLAEWSHQGQWFGAFALLFAAVIGVVVYLIARQFKTQEALAAMREERFEAERIEAERARLAAETELLKSERLAVLGQLTATVAHELRNPLSAIRNTLFTVKELAKTSGVKLDRPVARMERSIERCDRIISDLLEYTRQRDLNRAAVPFDRWLADIVADQLPPEPVVLVAELGAAHAMVPIDADRVRRVVINLVENASQALAERPGDREKRITVRTAVEDCDLVLVVEDTGPGIAPENLGRIFEPLFSTKSFGTGLGLPTVRQIVTQHGGAIEVDSEVGRGTCVTVRLPLVADAQQKMKVAA